jgi:hypothetical protein
VWTLLVSGTGRSWGWPEASSGPRRESKEL